MTAATDVQVEIDVDLDAEVPCVGLIPPPPQCPRPATFFVVLRHPAVCVVDTRSGTLCAPCVERVRQSVRRGALHCKVCSYVLRPEDLEVRPL